MKEILLYGSIWDYSAERFIREMEQAKNDPLTIRINSNGGNPESTWGMVAKIKEHAGRKLIKVDGRALSMGLFMLCYCDHAEALDVSQFLLHRAAYPAWIELNKEYMTDAMWDSLKKVNALLRAGLEAKIDVQKFEQIKGVTLDDVFDHEQRLDVNLTAQEALQIGLINRVVEITPQKRAELTGYREQMAAQGQQVDFSFLATAENKHQQITQKNKNMTLAELKAQHPEAYAQAVAEGINQERDRAGAWLEYNDVDPVAVKAGVAGGKNITQTEMVALNRKALSAQMLGKAEEENAPAVSTPEVKGEAGDKALQAFDAEVDAILGLNKK